MYKTFYLEIITPEKVFFKGDVEMLIVDTESGEMGVLAGHMSLVTALKAGEVKYIQEGQEHIACNTDGFMLIRPDEVVVLAQAVEKPEDIELARVQDAIDRAQERIRQGKSLKEYQMGKASLERAFARLKVRSRYDKQ